MLFKKHYPEERKYVQIVEAGYTSPAVKPSRINTFSSAPCENTDRPAKAYSLGKTTTVFDFVKIEKR